MTKRNIDKLREDFFWGEEILTKLIISQNKKKGLPFNGGLKDES